MIKPKSLWQVNKLISNFQKYMYIQPNSSCLYTVKPVLRGHLWDKKKWSFKTGDILKEVQFIWNLIGQEKDDLLVQVTA
jgi:hypothetical protein